MDEFRFFVERPGDDEIDESWRDEFDYEWLDPHSADCLDWLSSALQREFPDIELEPYHATEWRPGLIVSMPTQQVQLLGEVEKRAFELQHKLFFDKDVLVAITVNREDDGEDAG